MHLSPRRLTLALVLCVAASLMPPAVVAKGIPTRVTITGPGLAAPVIETDPRVMPALGILGLMDASNPVTLPDTLGPAFTLARDGFDRVRYYPGPGGSFGYVFYEGLVDDGGKISGASEYDGKWYRATPAGDGTLRAVLAMHGVGLGDNTPMPRTSSERVGTGAPPWVWLISVFVAGVLVGGGAVQGQALMRRSLPVR